MASKKIKEEQDFFNLLAKDIGGELLDDINPNLGFIDTGVLACNYICSGKFIGGGIPCGTLAEVSGQSAAGKSLLGTNLLKGCQNKNGVAVLLDAEFAISKDFAIRASHVDAKKLVVVTSDTLSGCFNKIQNIIRKVREEMKFPIDKPLVIVYDSIAASPSEREFNQTQFDMEETSLATLKNENAGTEKPGERAKVCSAELRKLMPLVNKNNTLVIFINQLRTNLMASYGADPQTEAGGGMAMKYYCSTRLRMYSSKKIKDNNKRIIGTNVRFSNTKSRFTAPFQEATSVRLFFESGIDPIGGLLDLMLQLGRVSGSGGNFIVNEPWTSGEAVKFKSSKESNIIPWEVLLKCPKLVDAETTEEVKYYMDTFGEANKTALQEGNIEEDIKDFD